MDRYYKAKDITNLVNAIKSGYGMIKSAEVLLADLPAIEIDDNADKEGEWIESFKPITVKQGYIWKTKFIHDGWSCSECSEVAEKRYPNCPYCLTRMKGEE